MTTLLAIDPSTTCTGLAVFRDGKLDCTRAATFGPAGSLNFKPDDLGDRARKMARMAVRWLPLPEPSEIITEWPQVYSKGKGDPNDLFVIAAIGTAIAMKYPEATFRSVLPAQWTGQIPKETDGKLRKRDLFTNPRAKRIIARLDEDELRVFHQIETYDELDAVGLGLHHVGRGITQRHRVYPGAT